MNAGKREWGKEFLKEVGSVTNFVSSVFLFKKGIVKKVNSVLWNGRGMIRSDVIPILTNFIVRGLKGKLEKS